MKAFEPKSPLAELPSRNSVYVSSLKKYLRQDEPVERILKLASQGMHNATAVLVLLLIHQICRYSERAWSRSSSSCDDKFNKRLQID